MTTEPLATWPRWRDQLILELRKQDVPGTAIGEILAEIDGYLVESRETPEQAFGEAGAYARTRGAIAQRGRAAGSRFPGGPAWLTWGLDGVPLSTLLVAAVCGVGGVITGNAAFALGRGDGHLGSVPAWLVLIVGFGLLGGPLFLLGDDPITDPRTGALARIGGPTFRGIPLLLVLVPALLAVGLGWFASVE